MSIDTPIKKWFTDEFRAGLVFVDSIARHYWSNNAIHYSVEVTSKKAGEKVNNND